MAKDKKYWAIKGQHDKYPQIYYGTQPPYISKYNYKATNRGVDCEFVGELLQLTTKHLNIEDNKPAICINNSFNINQINKK